MDSDTNMSPIDTEDVVMTEEDTVTNEESCIIDIVVNSNNENTVYTIASKEERKSRNKLTVNEFVRIIGERTKQLTMGAKPLIKINKDSEDFNYSEIAIEELKYDMLPFKIKRFINNKYEIWELSELKKNHLTHLF